MRAARSDGRTRTRDGQSGTTLFESFLQAGWNFFLALPIVVIGCTEYDVTGETAKRNPALCVPRSRAAAWRLMARLTRARARAATGSYFAGHWRLWMNVRLFVRWILNALLHATICFALPLAVSLNTWSSAGHVRACRCGTHARLTLPPLPLPAHALRRRRTCGCLAPPCSLASSPP